MKRREFIGASLAAAGAAALASCGIKQGAEQQDSGSKAHSGRMRLKFYPYELQLAHTFTVSSYSRKTTPDVQAQIEYDGLVGY